MSNWLDSAKKAVQKFEHAEKEFNRWIDKKEEIKKVPWPFKFVVVCNGDN